MRRLVLIAVAVLALDAGLTVPATAQEADPTPTITVTPTADLVDGEAVTVDGAGWRPGNTFHHLYVSVCPVDEGACDLVDRGFEAEADGTFHREVRVRAVFTSQYGDTVTDCRVVPCHLLVEEYLVPPRATEPLTFDPDAPLLPDPVLTITPDHDLIEGQPLAIHGTGFFPDESLLETICTPGLDPYSCYGGEVHADGAGVLDTTANARVFQLQWHGGYDCRPAPHCSVYLLDPNDRAVRASAPQHLRPDGDEVVTVSPTDGLPEVATVAVHATGLNEGYPVWVRQCWVDPAYADLPYFNPPWPTCADGGVSFAIGPERELVTTFTVHRRIEVTPGPGPAVTVDCAVDPHCNLSVGGDGVDALLHNGLGDRGAWEEIPLAFASDATPAAPATPTAVTPAFTG